MSRPQRTRRASVSLRRTAALMSPLKPVLSHSDIWVSYSDRNFASRSCPQTSGDLTPIVPLAVMIRSRSSIICSASGRRICCLDHLTFAPMDAAIPLPTPTQASPLGIVRREAGDETPRKNAPCPRVIMEPRSEPTDNERSSSE